MFYPVKTYTIIYLSHLANAFANWTDCTNKEIELNFKAYFDLEQVTESMITYDFMYACNLIYDLNTDSGRQYLFDKSLNINWFVITVISTLIANGDLPLVDSYLLIDDFGE